MLVLIWSKVGTGDEANPGFPTTILAQGLPSASMEPAHYINNLFVR